jgi:MYXO-CTERM domain-containing protein
MRTTRVPETVYTLTVQAPPGCRRVACPHPDPPPLDPMGLSVVLGSSESGTTGHLASAECSDNPYTLTLQLGEQGDAVLLNNIPFDCTAAPAPAPALDARGIVLALLVLLGVAALGFRRRRGPDLRA